MSVRRLDELGSNGAGDVALAAFGVDLRSARWPDERARFERLRARFEEDVAQVSSVHEMVETAAFRDIVAMGKTASRALLDDLALPDAPWLAWVIALRTIYGDGPTIPVDEAGERDKVIARWVAWMSPRT